MKNNHYSFYKNPLFLLLVLLLNITFTSCDQTTPAPILEPILQQVHHYDEIEKLYDGLTNRLSIPKQIDTETALAQKTSQFVINFQDKGNSNRKVGKFIADCKLSKIDFNGNEFWIPTTVTMRMLGNSEKLSLLIKPYIYAIQENEKLHRLLLEIDIVFKEPSMYYEADGDESNVHVRMGTGLILSTNNFLEVDTKDGGLSFNQALLNKQFEKFPTEHLAKFFDATEGVVAIGSFR